MKIVEIGLSLLFLDVLVEYLPIFTLSLFLQVRSMIKEKGRLLFKGKSYLKK